MKILQEGDKGRAICDRCAGIVATTFVRRDVPFSDGSGLAKNILVGACDTCGQTVSIPAQSTPAIGRARKETATSIEANLPAIYLDVLDCAVRAVDSRASTDFRRMLVTYFVHKAAGSAREARRLQSLHREAAKRFPERRGLARRRLSMKVSARMNEEFEALQERTALSTTELLKSVVVGIQDRILEQPEAALLEELRTLSVIAA